MYQDKIARPVDIMEENHIYFDSEGTFVKSGLNSPSNPVLDSRTIFISLSFTNVDSERIRR